MLANGGAWLPGQHRVRATSLPRWRASSAVQGSDGGQLDDDRVFQDRQRSAEEEETHTSLPSKPSPAAGFARKDAAVISRSVASFCPVPIDAFIRATN